MAKFFRRRVAAEARRAPIPGVAISTGSALVAIKSQDRVVRSVEPADRSAVLSALFGSDVALLILESFFFWGGVLRTPTKATFIEEGTVLATPLGAFFARKPGFLTFHIGIFNLQAKS